MQKLADHVDRVTQADRLFFEHFPAGSTVFGSPVGLRSTSGNYSTCKSPLDFRPAAVLPFYRLT